MRIKEENRNMFLLATVTLCCSALAGTLTLFDPVLEPVPGPTPEKPAAERVAIDAAQIWLGVIEDQFGL